MSKFSRHRVLILGLASPLLAFFFYAVVYNLLLRASSDHEKDWLRRLIISTFALTVPFLFTLLLFRKDRALQPRPRSLYVGLAVATLSLGLALSPIHDGVARWRQTRNMALSGVPAPLFDTPDISGKTQRLADQKGKVVLVNIWATWCGPCRAEMPNLDRLYRERQRQGFIVFGISDEDIAVQQKFLKQIPVSYPLLTQSGQVPNLYRDIALYPAIFLIDRQGNLQPAPATGLPFEKIQSAVDALLNPGS
jgi:peroxiredoxin